MLLPGWVVHPDAVGGLESFLLDGGKELVGDVPLPANSDRASKETGDDQ